MDDYIPNVAEAPIPIPFGELTFSAIESTTNPHPITVSNPVQIHKFPEIPQGAITFQALTCLEEWFSHGFTNNSDTSPPCSLWLGVISQILITIHNSIRRSHNTESHPHLFTSFSSLEDSDFQTLASSLSSLSTFITNRAEDPKAPGSFEICLHCLKECHIPITENELGSILLSCGQNIKAAHHTIINDKLCQLSDKMDTWVSTCHDAIKDAFINSVVNDTLPHFHDDHANEPRLLEWASHMKAAIQQTALSFITHQTITEVIDPWASEALEGAKAHTLHENNIHLTNYTRDQHALAEAKAISDANEFYFTTLTSLKAEALEHAECEVAEFKSDLKIKTKERKEAIRLDLVKCLPKEPSSPSKSASCTNQPKHRVNPTTQPLPRSCSMSHSRAPSPKTNPPSLPVQRLPSCTPHASPIVELPITRALTEPPTDISVGPPKNSQEAIMLGISTSQLSAYMYPWAPSAHEIAGPPLTMIELVISQSSTDPATSAVLSILNGALGDTLKQISSQLSVISTRIDAMESQFIQLQTEHPYSPSAPAALWAPHPTSMILPPTEEQNSLPYYGMGQPTFDIDYDMATMEQAEYVPPAHPDFEPVHVEVKDFFCRVYNIKPL